MIRKFVITLPVLLLIIPLIGAENKTTVVTEEFKINISKSMITEKFDNVKQSFTNKTKELSPVKAGALIVCILSLLAILARFVTHGVKMFLFGCLIILLIIVIQYILR